ncbi:DUF1549 domain-containing protein [Stratiformator vulcanicus]|uniref:DUF1549 domain-containing protein n=1 Tax=Stratiformator vulcanicus TaxID=2527980 RepID=A0A517R1M7_9PLAN|nr:DUF1549 domain-containing protein [Stratiformator vulcanicus]QDT37743.1 hypothetical protein Pan189_21250 [Stratiformator vulcanicus]
MRDVAAQSGLSEFDQLFDAFCEDALDADGMRRMERLVIEDPQTRRRYLELMCLHGTLVWDAALSDHPLKQPVTTEERRIRKRFASAMALAAALLVGLSAALYSLSGNQEVPVVVDADPQTDVISETPEDSIGSSPEVVLPERRPIELAATADPETNSAVNESSPDEADRPALMGDEFARNGSPLSSPELIAFIDQRLEAGWQDAGITPSDRAKPGAWLRRVSLDITGRIPQKETVDQFLSADLSTRSASARRLIVEQLIASDEYARHLGSVWTNLLVGRQPERSTDREFLELYMTRSFARDRGWDEIVADLISAEGSPKENGAAGFLVAHVNNEAVPATAITSRVLLGTQVQCMQCHDHPFNDWKQSDFWELNSFFKQVDLVERKQGDRMFGELVERSGGGPTFYENRRGIMRAAYPKYGGHEVSEAAEVNRRAELARLISTGSDRQLARAFVNRTWAHFFGAGFTRPVDDMGPHNPPSHPEILNALTEAFVASEYDVRQLALWICSTKAYALSSRFSEDNTIDDPAAGHMPLFSRVYVKPMTVEQIYDSLVVASGVEHGGIPDRDEWLGQFFFNYQNDENDEASTVGTLPQALAMMNSELVDEALEVRPGRRLYDIATARASDAEKIKDVCRTILSRNPTAGEMAAIKQLMRNSRTGPQTSPATGLQNYAWALLNSNEFAFVP